MKASVCVAQLVVFVIKLGSVLTTDVNTIERLSKNVLPSRYRLDLTTYLDANNFSYHGEVWIDFEVKEATNELQVHSKDLTIIQTDLQLLPTSLEQGEKIIFREDEDSQNTSYSYPPPLNPLHLPTTSRIPPERISTSPPRKPVTGTTQTTRKPATGTTAPTRRPTDRFTGTTPSANRPADRVTATVFPPRKPADRVPVPNLYLPPRKPVDRVTITTLPPRRQGDRVTPPTSRRPVEEAASTETSISNSWLNLYGVNGSSIDAEIGGTTSASVTTTASTNVTNTLWAQLFREPRPTRTKRDARVSIKNFVVDTRQDLLRFKLNGNLVPKIKYSLYLKYSGQLSDNLSGYYKVSYKEGDSNRTRWLSATVFEPSEARRAFPCFDEPGFKAKFQINLARRKELKSLSNMGLLSTKPMPDRPGWEVDSYHESPPMSTYLVAFLVGDLVAHEKPGRSEKPIKLWTRYSVPHQQTEYALESAPRFEQYFENYFEVKNPLKKIDMLALPNFISDALENWGLISFEEKYILHQPGVSTDINKQNVATIVAHELCHTWFGNLVTVDWWKDIWLNEGFATYFASQAIAHVHPEWDFEASQSVRAFLRVFSIDALWSSHPLAKPVEEKTDLGDIFDIVTYYKGFYVLRMLHHTLGENTFRKGVSKYLKAHLYGNVKGEDVWSILTRQGHEDHSFPPEMNLRSVMENWTNKTGYPVIIATRDYEDGTVDLTQSRFLRSKFDIESRIEFDVDEETTWWIPLTYTSQQDLRFNVTTPTRWMRPHVLVSTLRENIPGPGQWLLFNVKAVGLYRVKYDQQNYDLLAAYLNSKAYANIDVLNRAQLVDDVLDFARTGDLPYSVAFNITAYMTRETHYLPWQAMFSNLEFIQRMLQTTNATNLFKGFVRNLVTRSFNTLDFVSRSGEKPMDTWQRQQVIRWACYAGVKTCVDKSVNMFRQWNEINSQRVNKTNPIPSNVRPEVYCTAIANGEDQQWKFLWNQYLTTTIGSERSAILKALGCSRNTNTLKRYLDLSIDGKSGVRRQDSAAIFKAVAKNELGLNLALRFLTENVNKIRSFVGESPTHLPVLLDVLSSSMNQEDQMQKLEEFEIEHLGSQRTSSNSIKMSNEKLKFNINWMENNFESIYSWLSGRNY